MPKISTLWMRAAVLGSLWAGNEIIVGSFLHNLRVPMSGTFLALVSIAMMSGFLCVWKQKGLVIRAGLIAALMKSISPSAIIMGPMIGILSEAIMMELMITLVGTNRLGILLGGMMGVFSTFLQKVVTILVIYGFDFVLLLDNMFRFAVKQLHLQNLEPITAVWVLGIFYLAIGLSAATIGLFAGHRSKKLSPIEDFSMDWEEERDLDEGKARHSILIFVHATLIVFCMYMLNTQIEIVSFSLVGLYVVSVLFFYRNSLRRLKNLVFWMQMLVLVLITAVFWKWYDTGTFFHSEGVVVGLKMMMRALVVMMGFSAVSVELRNPLVKSLLIRKGFAPLYASLSLAFSALPTVLSNFVQPRSLLLRPIHSLASIIANADQMYMHFEEKNVWHRMNIITAPVNAGKTTFLKAVIARAKEEGIEIDGVLAEKIDLSQPKKGYNLVHIKEERRERLCDDIANNNALKKGPFYFSLKAFENGIITLSNTLGAKGSVLVLDEIGPLEMSGKGWYKVLTKIVDSDKVSLLVVRENLVEEFVEKFKIKHYNSISPNVSEVEEVVDMLKRFG